MPDLLSVAVLALLIYNTVVLHDMRQTARRLSDSVEVLVARSDINHDQSMHNRDMIERHDHQIHQLGGLKPQ